MQLTSEEIPPLVIIAVSVLFIIAAVIGIIRRNSYGEWLRRTAADKGFGNATMLKDTGWRYCLAFDDKNSRVMLVRNKDVYVIPQKQLACNMEIRYRTAEQDNVLRDSLKGYMIAGKTGATIYGLRSRPTQKTYLTFLALRFIFADSDPGLKECRITLSGAETGDSAIDTDGFWGKSELRVKDRLLRRFLDQLEERNIPVCMDDGTDDDTNGDPIPYDYHLPGAEDEY